MNINVLQTNFPPFFYSSFYFAYIEEDLEVGDPVITTIQAADFDQVGLNRASESCSYGLILALSGFEWYL